MLRGAARTAAAQAMRRLYEAGQSIQDIAARAGRSVDVVYTLLVSAGTEFRPTLVAPLGSVERAELAAMLREGYDAGLTQSEVARSVGCDHDTARRLITEAGGTIRTEVVAGLDDLARPILARRLREEYEAGAGLAELSAELRCRESSVRCLLVEAGATIRPPSTPPVQSPREPPPGQMGLRELATVLGWRPPTGRRLPHPVTERDAAEMVARYRDGETIKGVALDMGYPYSRVRGALLTAGVELRKPGGRRT